MINVKINMLDNRIATIVLTTDTPILYKNKFLMTSKFNVSTVEISRLLNAIGHAADFTLFFKNKTYFFEQRYFADRLSEQEILEFKIAPLPHQIDVINFTLAKHNKWLLLDSMGLG